MTYEPTSRASATSRVGLMWLFIMCWSAYGIEVCASFAPEYHDTKRDTSLALKSSAAFSLFVYIFLPLGLGGVVGTAGDFGTFYVDGLRDDRGHGARRDRHRLSDRQPDPVDEHCHGRRRPGALRHRPRRHDDQVVLPPQPLPRSGRGHDRGHGRERRADPPAGREQPRDPLPLQHRLRVLPRSGAHRVPAAAAGPSRLAAADQGGTVVGGAGGGRWRRSTCCS